MALNKITETQMSASGVVSAPDILTGTAAENKAVFDRMIRDVVTPCINAMVDALMAYTGADEIGAKVEGVDADTIQGVLDVLYSKIIARYTKGEVDEMFAVAAKDVAEEMAPVLVGISYKDYELTLTAKNGKTTTFNIRGAKGDTGPQGPQGEKGDKGDKGDTGATGPQGERGPQGIQGATGPRGDTGAQGPAGEKGADGAAGPQGEKGEKGADGYTPVKGTDYWTNADKAEMESEAVDILSGSLLDENGVIKHGALPAGYPYASRGKVIVPKATVTCDGTASFVVEHEAFPEEGKTYEVTVTTGDVSASCFCVAEIYNFEELQLVINAKEPEINGTKIYFAPGELMSDGKDNASVKAPVAGTYTVSVYEVAEFAKIDKNYLPDDIGGGGESLLGEDGKIAEQYLPEIIGEPGPQGEKGEKGEKGDKGADGYTPEKGADYWTEADKAEIEADAADILSGSLLTEHGIIRQSVLPVGVPYANDEIIIDRADTTALAENSSIKVLCNRFVTVGETCCVIWETEEEVYVVDSVVGSAGNANSLLVSKKDPYVFLGGIYFFDDEPGFATIRDANKVPYRITVFVKGDTTKIDRRFLPDDIGKNLLNESGKVDDKYLPDVIGEPGPQGDKGEDGYTPVRGKDYWTEADKTEIIDEVLESIPEGGGNGDLLNENGIIKQEVLPDGYPYITSTVLIEETREYISGGINGHGGIKYTALPEVGKSYEVTVLYEVSGTAAVLGGTYSCIAEDGYLGPQLVVDARNVEIDGFEIRFESTGAVAYSPKAGFYTIMVKADSLTKIDKKYLPDDIGGGSGADLLNANGIIKQEVLPVGYPYAESGYLVPETTVEITGDGGFIANTVKAAIGETYTVNWNGTEYSCECAGFDMDGLTIPAVGDLGLMMGEEGTGEPFLVLLFTEEQVQLMGEGIGVVVYAFDESTIATLSIMGKTITKLDPKFLPEGYPYEIKNAEIVYVPEQVPNLEMDGMLSGNIIVPEAGQTVTVTYCGTDYECVVATGSMEGTDFVYCGNGAVLGLPESSEPFILAFIPGVGNLCAPAAEEIPDDFKVKVTAIADELYTMDSRFMPEGYPKTELVDEEVMPEIQLTNIRVGNSNWAKTGVTFVKGETYTVTWNGNEYTAVAGDYTFEGNNFGIGVKTPVVGICRLSDEWYELIGGSSDTQFDVIDDVSSATVSVYGPAKKIIPLDKKYLPDLAGLMSVPVIDLIEEGFPTIVKGGRDYIDTNRVHNEKWISQMAAGPVIFKFNFKDPRTSEEVIPVSVCATAMNLGIAYVACGIWWSGNYGIDDYCKFVIHISPSGVAIQSLDETVLRIKSPSGKLFKITVDEDGNLTTTQITI